MATRPINIRGYSPRTTPQGVASPALRADVRSPNAQIADGVSALGEGVTDLARSEMQVDRILDARAEDAARVQVSRAIAEARVAATRQLEEARTNASDGAVGLTKGYEGWLTQYGARIAQGFQNSPHATRLWAENFGQFQINALDVAASAEREEGRAFRLDGLRQTAEQGSAALIADPGAFAQFIDEQTALINGLRDVTPDDRRDLLASIRGEAASASVAGLIRQQPGRMLQLLSAAPGDNPDPRNPISFLDARQRLSMLNQAQAEVDRREAQARAALTDTLALQSRDLEMGLPVRNPVSVAQVRAVFGEARARAWELELASSEQWSGLATQNNAQLAAIVATPRLGGDATADEIRDAEARRLAAGRILERRSDPQAFLIQQGVSSATGLTSSFRTAITPAQGQDQDRAWTQFFSLLSRRGAAAQEGAARYQLDALPLTQEEAQFIGGALSTMPAQSREAFYQRARRALTVTRPRHAPQETAAYAALTRQLAGADPVSGYAGQIYGVNSETMQGTEAARLILRGQDALGSGSGGSGEGGEGRRTSALNMPAEDALRRRWATMTGNAYENFPDAGARAYEIFRAHYAGATSQANDGSGSLNNARAQAAMRAATGGVMEWAGRDTLLPWGMAPDTFRERVDAAWPAVVAANPGLEGAQPRDFELIPTSQPGVYRLSVDDTAVAGANGAPVTVRVRAQ